jgi:hypothetical protein
VARLSSTTPLNTESRDGDFGHLCTGTEAIRKSGGAESIEGEAMKKYSALIFAGLLLLILGCQGKPTKEAPTQEPMSIDHPLSVDPAKPNHFLHNIFSVNHHAQFSVLVPAHQENARVRGTFRSFTERDNPDSSDKRADVDLLLLNDEEFQQFLHGQLESITHESNSAHNQTVDWFIPATRDDAKTYHLVFVNSVREAKPKFVQADFTLTFE